LEGPIAWIYPDEFDITKDDTDTAIPAHGTCVLTRAIGIWGSSRSAAVTIGRLDTSTSYTQRKARIEQQVLTLLIQILNEVIKNSLQKRAVVNFSVGWNGLDDPGLGAYPIGRASLWARQLYLVVKKLVAQDVIFVTSAGNEGQADKTVIDVPAIWATDIGFISTAATDSQGVVWNEARYLPNKYWPNSGANTWASGVDVVCPARSGNSDFLFQTGSSFCKLSSS